MTGNEDDDDDDFHGRSFVSFISGVDQKTVQWEVLLTDIQVKGREVPCKAHLSLRN